MYKLLLSRKSQKDLEKTPEKDKERIISKLIDLEKDPLIGKKLKGKLSKSYSLRVWPYRIIYEIRRKKLIILVIRIGHRKNIYK